MKPHILRDIFVKKSKHPLRDEDFFREKESGGKADVPLDTPHDSTQSPFIVDLSGEHRVMSAPDHSPKEPGILVSKKISGMGASVFVQLMSLAMCGVLILFALASARSFSAGEKLLNELAVSAKKSYSQLIGAGRSREPGAAKSMFEQAYSQFQNAQKKVWFLEKDPLFRKYTSVLESGQLLADSGEELTAVMEMVRQIPASFARDMQGGDVQDSPTALSLLTTAQKKIITVHSNIGVALERLRDIRGIVPETYLASFDAGLQLLSESERLLSDTVAMLPGILEILGDGGAHHTLVLLQNNDEVRATGGFIGSYLDLVMDRGRVVSLSLQDVYDLPVSYEKSEPPPPELAFLTDHWVFRDANFSPDFAVSGKKLLSFYRREARKPADSVLAVNQDLFQRILEIVGPIEIPQLTAPLTAENYRQVLTYMIETKRSGLEDPKKIMKDLLPAVQAKLFQANNMESLQKMVLEEIVQKNILGYSNNSLVQDFFEVLGADGRMSSVRKDEDFLSVVAISSSANKSDASMSQELSQDTVIDRDGSIYHQLTIKRSHLWSGATETKWKQVLKPFGFVDFPEHFLRIFGKGDNLVTLRVYLPDESEIISTENIVEQALVAPQAEPILQYDEDTSRSYLSFLMRTPAGSSNTVKIRYRLPFRLNNLLANTYTFIVQKQPGTRASQFSKRITFTDYMALARTYPETGFVNEGPSVLSIAKPLTRDQRFSLLFTRESMLGAPTSDSPTDTRR